MAEALYRKYRPQVFGDVVGQEHIERTIKNAIAADKLSHAYLFTGPRGTGKTTTARLLAKALLCSHGPTPEPDGTCEDCRMIADGVHPDVYELDAASRTGVDNVREEIIGRVQFAPTRGRYKVYIIDEVHMLTTAAFNALLKTLEEPPDHVVFVLATTDPQKVPETIHSRCQRFDFRRIGLEGIVARLGAVCTAEGVEFEGEALELVAHRAEGGLRNALTALEQLIAFGGGKVTVEAAERMLGGLDSSELAAIVRHIGQRDVAACFRWTADFVEGGSDLAQFARDLAEHVRNLYVLSLAGADVDLEVSESVRRELAEELPLFGPDRLARLLGVLGDLSAELRTSINPRLSFEIALTRMVRPDSDLTLAALAERVEALEAGYSAVAHVTSAGAAAASGAGGTAAEPWAGAVAGGAAGVEARPASGGVQVAAEAHPAVASRAAGQVASSQASSQGASEAAAVARAAEPAPMRHAASGAAADAASDAQAARQGAGRSAAAHGSAQAANSSADEAAAQGGLSAAGALSADLAATLQNPASLQRLWQAAVTSLKKSKAAYGVLFLNTKAVFHADRGIVAIDFAPENAFAFKAVQKPDVQESVAAALLQACGAAVPFMYTQGSANVMGGGTSAAASVASHSAGGGSAPAAGAAAHGTSPARTPYRDDAPSAASPVRQGGATNAASAPSARTDSPMRSAVAAPAPDPVPYDDQVPVDAYDSYAYEPVPYDDVVPSGFEPQSKRAGASHAAATAGSARTAVAAAAQSHARPAAPAESGAATIAGASAAASAPQAQASPTPAVPAERVDASTHATPETDEHGNVLSGVQSADDLSALLAATGFGEGIAVKEVQ